MVIRLLQDREAESRYIESMVKAFVEDNPRYNWCPAADCDHAIFLNETNTMHNEAVVCVCGTTFCFRCLGPDHRPATCEMTALWKKKNASDDDDSAQAYIAAISRYRLVVE